MKELEQLISVMGGDSGVVAQIAAWMASARVVLKPFSEQLLAKMTDAMVRAAESDESDDDGVFEAVLGSRFWRWTSFVADFLLSLKLPSLKLFNQLKEKSKQKQP